MSNDAYFDGMKLLARRELSEAQVRQRLGRRGHRPDAIDSAVERLKSSRAIDDARVAEAIARTERSIRKRGKLRVKQQIERAGIAAEVARTAITDVCAQTDDAELIEGALAKRLRGSASIADDREFHRLYRYLLGQGFEPELILKSLDRRRATTPRDDE
jgi:regulatory protein